MDDRCAIPERQSLDSLEQGKTWAEAFDSLIHDYEEKREGAQRNTSQERGDYFFSGRQPDARGAGKPNTVRGRSANLLLTEFDFFEQPAETWRLRSRRASPTRQRESQKKSRIVTTPNGIGGAMQKIWTKAHTDKMRMEPSFGHHLSPSAHGFAGGHRGASPGVR